MNRYFRLEPHALHLVAARLPGVHLDLAPRLGAVAVLGADGRRLDADRPDPAGASEQCSQAVDGSEEITAVLFHHRQQKIAARVTRQARVVLERRQP